MTFTLHIEHEIIGGKTVLETFEGVEQFNNPSDSDVLHIAFADEEQDDKRLNHGHIARASDKNQ